MPKYVQKKATPATGPHRQLKAPSVDERLFHSRSRLRSPEGRALNSKNAYELTNRLKRPNAMTT